MAKPIISADSHVTEPPAPTSTGSTTAARTGCPAWSAHLSEADRELVRHDNVAALYDLDGT